MHDRVIIEPKPQILGNYYEPYHIPGISEMIYEARLTKEISQELLAGRCAREFQYEESWETLRWL